MMLEQDGVIDMEMEESEKDIIDIEIDGEIKEAELICVLDSEKDDKQYAILTTDEEISDEINIIAGILHEDNDEFTIEIVDDDEYEYVLSLMDKIEKSDFNV